MLDPLKESVKLMLNESDPDMEVVKVPLVDDDVEKDVVSLEDSETLLVLVIDPEPEPD